MDCDATDCLCAGDEYLVEDGGNLVCQSCGDGYYTFEEATGTEPVYECKKCTVNGAVWDSGSCQCPGGLVLRSTFCVDETAYNTATVNYQPETEDSLTLRNAESSTDDWDSDSLGTIPVNPSDTFTTLLPEALYSCVSFQDDK